MAQGSFDHPSYLARQSETLTQLSTAGANTVQLSTAGLVFPFDVRVRNAVAFVQTAGTSASGGNAAVLYVVGTCVQFPAAAMTYGTLSGAATGIAVTTNTTTTTIGTVALGSATAGSYAISGDMNVRIPAGTPLLFKNGTDATGRYMLTVEYHLDPTTATWTGTS